MSDENAAGKRFGHVLLAIVRFVLGAGVGFLIWLSVVNDVDGGDWLLLAVCIVVPGVLVVLLGNRVLRWALEILIEQ